MICYLCALGHSVKSRGRGSIQFGGVKTVIVGRVKDSENGLRCSMQLCFVVDNMN